MAGKKAKVSLKAATHSGFMGYTNALRSKKPFPKYKDVLKVNVAASQPVQATVASSVEKVPIRQAAEKAIRSSRIVKKFGLGKSLGVGIRSIRGIGNRLCGI